MSSSAAASSKPRRPAPPRGDRGGTSPGAEGAGTARVAVHLTVAERAA